MKKILALLSFLVPLLIFGQNQSTTVPKSTVIIKQGSNITVTPNNTAAGTFTISSTPNLTALGGVTGSGTSGVVPLWSGTNSQTNSSITQSSGVVNIPTLTSSSVVATTVLTNTLVAPLQIGGTSTTQPLTFRTTTGAGTTGADFIWQNGTNGATEQMRLLNNGSLLINGTARYNNSSGTTSYFELNGSATRPALSINSFSTSSSDGSQLWLQRSRNASIGGNGLTLNTNTIGSIYFAGNSGSGFLPVAAIISSMDAASGASDMPGNLVFYTTPDGSITVTEAWRISHNQTLSNTGAIGTAYIHLKAGTATASTAPLKFTSGTNNTTAETGAMEYNGTNLFFTRTGTTRESIITANAVNAVSPTSPNRTITVVIDGTTYYIHAKTTND